MLNPELIRIYGRDKCSFIDGLARALGSELASSCYVLFGREQEYNGSTVPRYIRTSNSNKAAVSLSIYDYILQNTGEYDEVWIFVFGDTETDEEGVRLWLS